MQGLSDLMQEMGMTDGSGSGSGSGQGNQQGKGDPKIVHIKEREILVQVI